LDLVIDVPHKTTASNGLITEFGALKVLFGQFYQHFTRGSFVGNFGARLFLYLHFRFLFSWSSDIGTKAAHKMLVKLTPLSHGRIFKILLRFFFYRSSFKQDLILLLTSKKQSFQSILVFNNAKKAQKK
jgi:hypothetical protein